MPEKIMLLRHGEKPDPADSVHGVDVTGQHNKNDLAPKGWQRSGALVRYFNPLNVPFSHPALARPTAIFAASPEGHVKSLRSQNTVQALADSLQVRLHLKHSKGEEKALVEDVLTRNGVVLVAWEHNAIIGIANLILGNDRVCPQKWPDSRFDMVWVLDRLAETGKWVFTQVPQRLLPGDSEQIL